MASDSDDIALGIALVIESACVVRCEPSCWALEIGLEEGGCCPLLEPKALDGVGPWSYVLWMILELRNKRIVSMGLQTAKTVGIRSIRIV